jgi:uncharacterized protein (DUF1015 family)
MADVQGFRAVRYSGAAGALFDLVAPPYDAVTAQERDELQARSPYNVLHLTLPDSVEDAGRRYRDWLSSGVLVREESPATWFISEQHRGRERHGLVVSLPAEPYSEGAVLPHERTYPRVRDDRLELLRATGVQLEPIFLLVDGPLGVDVPVDNPDLEANGARLWRLPAADAGPLSGAGSFLIADGHHRYESALAFGVGTRVMALVVSAGDPGLEVFPTHRVFRDRPELAELREGDEHPDLESATAELQREPFSHSAVIAYRAGRVELVRGTEGELDAELVDRYGLDGLDYTPQAGHAVDLVDRGEADVAFILRAPRVEDVFSVARQGKRMPPKSTYFFPKPLSGLLFHPVDA